MNVFIVHVISFNKIINKLKVMLAKQNQFDHDFSNSFKNHTFEMAEKKLTGVGENVFIQAKFDYRNIPVPNI